MRKAVCAGLIAGSMVLLTGEAASAPAAQTAAPQIATVGDVLTGKDSQTARPFSAILRYGPGTTSICRSLSDNSSAICLLLALHVIQLSQKPLSDTKL
jgi:hypothetical protein